MASLSELIPRHSDVLDVMQLFVVMSFHADTRIWHPDYFSSFYLCMNYSFSLCTLKKTWNVAVRSRQSLARHFEHAHVNRRATQGQSAHAAAQSQVAGILSRADLALQADVEVYERAGGSAP